MEELEKVLKDSDIVGICPETGREAVFKYSGKVIIEYPERRTLHDVQCSICNNQHHLRDIGYFRIERKGKVIYRFRKMTIDDEDFFCEE